MKLSRRSFLLLTTAALVTPSKYAWAYWDFGEGRVPAPPRSEAPREHSRSEHEGRPDKTTRDEISGRNLTDRDRRAVGIPTDGERERNALEVASDPVKRLEFYKREDTFYRAVFGEGPKKGPVSNLVDRERETNSHSGSRSVVEVTSDNGGSSYLPSWQDGLGYVGFGQDLAWHFAAKYLPISDPKGIMGIRSKLFAAPGILKTANDLYQLLNSDDENRTAKVLVTGTKLALDVAAFRSRGLPGLILGGVSMALDWKKQDAENATQKAIEMVEEANSSVQQFEKNMMENSMSLVPTW